MNCYLRLALLRYLRFTIQHAMLAYTVELHAVCFTRDTVKLRLVLSLETIAIPYLSLIFWGDFS